MAFNNVKTIDLHCKKCETKDDITKPFPVFCPCLCHFKDTLPPGKGERARVNQKYYWYTTDKDLYDELKKIIV